MSILCKLHKKILKLKKIKKLLKISCNYKKYLLNYTGTEWESLVYIYGSIAQLGEHLPYKQGVIGSSPIVPTNGLVGQWVRTLACHARGRGFESHPGRQTLFCSLRPEFASVAQLVEQRTENPRVVGSIPTGGTIKPSNRFSRI